MRSETRDNPLALRPPEAKEWEDPWNRLVIDLDAIQTNYQHLRSGLPEDCVFYAVLKSDAYGHGITEVSNALIEAGCQHFAVGNLLEAIQIRKQGVKGDILLLNPIPSWAAEAAVFNDLSVSVIHQSILQPLEDACEAMGKTCKIHLKVNVGLNRLGIAPSRSIKIAKEALAKPHLRLEGLYAQPRDPASARDGFEKVKAIYERMQSEGIAPRRFHFANSTTFLSHPDTIADGVRLGILIYGVLPPEQSSEDSIIHGIKPAMSLYSKIVQLRELPKGSKIGYRAKQKTLRDSVIGTIPIGYAHGLDRRLSRSGYVLVRGKRAPFIGAISMNDSTIDLTEIPDVQIGDDVIIVGEQNSQQISINELASSSGTISAELMMRFGRGVARQYVSGRSMQKTSIKFQREPEDIRICYIQTEKDLPEWISVFEIMEFLRTQMSPFDDPIDQIRSALDFALSSVPYGKGFLMLAFADRMLVGVVVSIHNNTRGFNPENVFVYICVHQDYRNMGLGSRLVREAVRWADGDVKIHVPKENPAVDFYRKLGFRDDYLEMRYYKHYQKRDK